MFTSTPPSWENYDFGVSRSAVTIALNVPAGATTAPSADVKLFDVDNDEQWLIQRFVCAWDPGTFDVLPGFQLPGFNPVSATAVLYLGDTYTQRGVFDWRPSGDQLIIADYSQPYLVESSTPISMRFILTDPIVQGQPVAHTYHLPLVFHMQAMQLRQS